MPTRRFLLTFFLTPVLVVLGAMAGWTYWTAHGTGTASATTGTINAPAAPVATNTPRTSTVHLTWNGTSLSSGQAATGYYVTPSGGVPASPCGTSASPLVGSARSCDYSGVADGAHTYTVTAVYNSWTATSLPSITVTVTSPIVTTTSVTPSVNPSVSGQTVTYTATVTPNSGTPAPTGTVTFKDNGTAINCSGSSTLNVSGVATCQIAYAGVGTQAITAAYSGDTNFTTSTSVGFTQTVNQGSQTINFTSTAPGAATVGGSTYTVVATGGASGNAVAFATATPLVCTVSTSTVSFIAVGTCTINANQASSTNYNAAPQVQQTFAVAKGNQTISFTSAAPLNAGAGSQYSVSATSASGLPVAITIDATSSSVCSIASSTVTFKTVGTCKVDANQTGDANFNPATQVQQSITVVALNAPTGVSLTMQNGTKITPSWTSAGAGITYECQVTTPQGTAADLAGTWFTCASGTQKNVSAGAQTFYVRSISGAVKSAPSPGVNFTPI